MLVFGQLHKFMIANFYRRFKLNDHKSWSVLPFRVLPNQHKICSIIVPFPDTIHHVYCTELCLVQSLPCTLNT